MSAPLSVIIITKNVEADIERCLESVKWAQEIVILDSGSTDKTLEICRCYTSQIFSTDWPGFGIQKNRALAKASQEWILSLDADEWLSQELQTEIQNILSQPLFNSYELQRRSKFLGRWIFYGDWKNDRVIRLFKKEYAEFTNQNVHEKLLVVGPIGKIRAPLFHEPFKTLDTVIDKLNRYTNASTLDLGHLKKGSLFKALFHGFWRFFRGYILKLGFLDGKEGFILAVSNAESSYYRYLKLYYQQLRKNNL